MRKHKLMFTFLCLVVLSVCIWGVFLLKCEILTVIHKDDFIQNDVIKLLGDGQNCKVITYFRYEAEVYYISRKKNMGNLLTFVRTGDAWEIKNWNTVWSKDGSADGIVWPYWWHFIYSH